HSLDILVAVGCQRPLDLGRFPRFPRIEFHNLRRPRRGPLRRSQPSLKIYFQTEGHRSGISETAQKQYILPLDRLYPDRFLLPRLPYSPEEIKFSLKSFLLDYIAETKVF